MSKEFFDDNEKRDYELFNEFMTDVCPNGEWGRTETYYYCDATGKTTTDTIDYEIKWRTYKFDENKRVLVNDKNKEFTDLIIEAHKLADLLISVLLHNKSKYINFMETDGVMYAFCYDIGSIKEHLKKHQFNNIYSKGYGKQEDGWRFLIPIKDCVIFKKENNGKYKKI